MNLKRIARIAPMLGLAGLAHAAWPVDCVAETANKILRIGHISFADRELRTHLDRALMEGLREKGYVEGVNLVIENRYAAGSPERVPEIAKELAGLQLDAIVTTCTPTTRAMQAATRNTTPLVMAAVSDPVGQGLIASYARPGGNITGTASQFEDAAAKMLQLLHEVVPSAVSIAILRNPRNPIHAVFVRDMEAAASTLGIKLAPMAIGRPDDVSIAFEDMRRKGIDAVMILPDDPFLFHHRPRIVELLTAHRLPSFFGVREAVDGGGLISYGEPLRQAHYRAAHYLDQILKGGMKPGDLPVEQPTRFELIINLKTAKALGITVPQSILARADEVIE